VRDLCPYVFDKVGLGDYSRYVRTAERYRRPYELKHLRGDASKACQLLGWEPR
jgi:GDPmannose 4,6-dehydratase